MRQTVEQRLKKLYDQRAALETQIKKIEAEKAQELRKRQEQRERLVGKVIYALVKSGEWSEAQLLELVEPHLKRASERALFDWPVERNETAGDKGQSGAGAASKKKKTVQKSISSAQSKQPKTKPAPVSQSELEDEFNL